MINQVFLRKSTTQIIVKRVDGDVSITVDGQPVHIEEYDDFEATIVINAAKRKPGFLRGWLRRTGD